jgi:hypothetical protein
MPEEGRSSESLDTPRASGRHCARAPARNRAVDAAVPARGRHGDRGRRGHFRDLWHVVVKRKWSILAVFLIVVVATAIGTLMQTPIYRAEMTLRIDATRRRSSRSRTAPSTTTGTRLLPDPARAPEESHARERVVAQMKAEARRGDRGAGAAVVGGALPQGQSAGRTVVRRGGHQGGRAQRRGFAARWIGRHAHQEHQDGPRVLCLGEPAARDRRAQSARAGFIGFNLEQRYDQSSFAKTFLEEKLAETKAKLETNERALIDFQRANAIVSVDDRQTVLSSTLSDYNTAANKAEQDLAKATSLYRAHQDQPGVGAAGARKQDGADDEGAEGEAAGRVRRQPADLQAGLSKMQQLQAQMDELDKASRPRSTR